MPARRPRAARRRRGWGAAAGACADRLRPARPALWGRSFNFSHAGASTGENGAVTPQDAAELPLVGRATELEEVETRLRAGGCVAVAGPLGIGKSRLLAELAGRADARGHVVLAGGGSEYEVGVPYGVAVETLADYLASLGPGEHATLAPELAPLFPALVPAAPPTATVDAERFHTHRA